MTHIQDSRTIVRVDIGLYRRDLVMAPSQVLLEDPCPLGLTGKLY